MCGIAGIVGEPERGAARVAVEGMVRALERRGPDGKGIESWDGAVLGHRRLAIFDLSEAGRQPMSSADGLVSVVFNGAVYNWRPLRAELESRGIKFRSQTDTEVLVEGYREWGIDALVARLRGMFAFGLWDAREKKLFLVRDRLGVKPLLYAARPDGTLAFASTASALRRAGFAGSIDEQSVAEFLEFGYVTDDRSIYEGVRKVPAATLLEWSEGGEVKSREYWTPPTAAKDSKISFDEAVEEAERLFVRAVEMRLQADVPVGALLSGGVDSSLVCWAVARLGGDVTAYTVGTPGDPSDETADARATAAALGVRHKVLDVSADDAPRVSELSAAYGEPFACASALGMLRVSRAVANEATVLLTGDGGDDVFLGYPEHRHFQLAARVARATPDLAARAWLASREGFPRTGPLKRVASFMNYAAGGLGAVADAHDGLPSYRRTGMLGERLDGVNVAHRSIEWSRDSARDLLTEFLAYDRRTRFVGEYLTKVDGATMFHALEARSPFLDQELWEFAAALPYSLRMRGGTSKAVLREMARRRVGDSVARGRKRGFTVPVGRWVAARWRAQVAELLRDSLAEKRGWIRAGAALAQLEEAARRGSAPNQLWYVYVLESWLRHEQSDASSQPSSPRERETEAALSA